MQHVIWVHSLCQSVLLVISLPIASRALHLLMSQADLKIAGDLCRKMKLQSDVCVSLLKDLQHVADFLENDEFAGLDTSGTIYSHFCSLLTNFIQFLRDYKGLPIVVRCNKRRQMVKNLDLMKQHIGKVKADVGTLEAQARTTAALLLRDAGLLSLLVAKDEVMFGRKLWFGYKGVWKGMQVSLREVYADQSCLPAAHDEIKLTARLSHSNIVRCIGYTWREQYAVFMITEYVGEHLPSLIRKYIANKHPIGFDLNKTKIALQIADALMHAHSLSPPGVHGNLKPTNVRVTEALEVKLTGFGSYREGIGRVAVRPPMFDAPEVLKGKAIDERADMFSFGMLLSYLDQQAIPYANVPHPQYPTKPARGMWLVGMIIRRRVQPTFSSGGQTEMAALGRACTNFNADDRPSAAEVAAILRATLNSLL